uniref:Uncharacterized protein n=1 Tax=Trypanosoma congolense (strain IL3000) TaxID=1068625 RepID=G0V0D1_TRYCI|nr:hypothetical protein, unlikely [Trypanosoma congolense IL3000]
MTGPAPPLRGNSGSRPGSITRRPTYLSIWFIFLYLGFTLFSFSSPTFSPFHPGMPRKRMISTIFLISLAAEMERSTNSLCATAWRKCDQNVPFSHLPVTHHRPHLHQRHTHKFFHPQWRYRSALFAYILPHRTALLSIHTTSRASRRLW